MAEAKTKATTISVAAYLDAIEHEGRRKDCSRLVALMQRATGHAPVMWGTSIVGFGHYHYTYASGREGDSCIVGFSSRKEAISVYLLPGLDGIEPLLAALGPHKAGKGCLYVKRLDDVQIPVLERLLARAVAEAGRRYPKAAT